MTNVVAMLWYFLLILGMLMDFSIFHLSRKNIFLSSSFRDINLNEPQFHEFGVAVFCFPKFKVLPCTCCAH